MSVGYRMVQWNAHKRRYDGAAALFVGLYLALFVVVSSLVWRGDQAISPPILLLRALGSCAYLLLSVILCLGPLARLHPRFLPLLYNRRHLGVTTALLALAHGLLVLVWYHGFGKVAPWESILTSNTQYGSIAGFPFETLGIVALLIMLIMAATSHDFWLHNLTPGIWKTLHLLVYPAWALLVGHVALGALQSERSPVYIVIVALGVIVVAGLHLAAGLKQRRSEHALRRDRGREPGRDDGGPSGASAAPPEATWVDAGAIADWRQGCGRTVVVAAERIAVFRHGDGFSAVSNVCVHQGGPLGEGRIVDGCITCPWHGYQYRPGDGQSPPPFTEKLPTYQVRIMAGRVQVNPQPLPPGTAVPPAVITSAPASVATTAPAASAEFYVGYLPVPACQKRFLVAALAVLMSLPITTALVLAWAQRHPGAGVWDLDTPVQLTGAFHAQPYPMLVVAATPQQPAHVVLLVEEGKHGVGDWAHQFDGQPVTIHGHFLRRGELELLELSGEEQAVAAAASVPTISSAVGAAIPPLIEIPTDLHGEIIDPKCYAGAMKPGEGKTHKACAALCLRGGIPPVLLVRPIVPSPANSHPSATSWYVMTDEEGHRLTGAALERVVDLVGEPVRLHCVVTRRAGLPVVQVQLSTLQRE